MNRGLWIVLALQFALFVVLAPPGPLTGWARILGLVETGVLAWLLFTLLRSWMRFVETLDEARYW
ncbi:hypothetical protein V3390_00220 [Luteimonas sp. FXH3W]|uniref:Uncharacterized protein n=1 Tax=Aquilutibacter rugosus TaxID=3115820 RepID=A0ABU7UYM7_9GAMM